MRKGKENEKKKTEKNIIKTHKKGIKNKCKILEKGR